MATGSPLLKMAMTRKSAIIWSAPPKLNCPGFGSVAKYVAVSTREASFDVASMAKTSTKVFVIEVMGRHAGWIAAAGGLAADDDTDLPIVILFPEVEFNEKKTVAFCGCKHTKTQPFCDGTHSSL